MRASRPKASRNTRHEGNRHDRGRVTSYVVGIVWGLIIAAVGALFIVWGRTRSDFAVYRLLVARSRILWGEGDRVHGFYQSPARP